MNFMSKELTAYERLGASASKTEVHAATAGTDTGLFPGAFCRIAEDVLGGDADWCSILHADGAGTKALAAYIIYRESGDPSVFRGIAQDALVMNLDDLACVGAVDRFLLANNIARNSKFIPGAVLKEVIAGYEDVMRILRGLGVSILATGGETADLVDNVRTIVVDATVATRLRRDAVIDNRNIAAGDVIVGLSSTGQASYEDHPNSGIGSNGLTLARHALLHRDYVALYPESVSPDLDPSIVYRGPFAVDARPDDLGMTIGAALCSPTRTYLPVIRDVLKELRPSVHGIVHNTGGGQAKCLHFSRNIHFIKDNLFSSPPLFRLIAEHGGVPWNEMYQTFNMGHRMEIYAAPSAADRIVAIAHKYHIEAKVIGRCEPADVNRLTLITEFGTFQ